MKRSKILLSAVAAAVFATSAGALVACGDGVDLPAGGNGGGGSGTHVVTFVPGDGATLKGISGTTMTTNKEGKLEGDMPTAEKTDHTFNGWAITSGGAATLTTANFNTWVFSEDMPVYAVFTYNGSGGPKDEDDDEARITFSGGLHGTVSFDSAKTVNGKIATFPMVTEELGWEHTGWKDSNGGVVTLDTVFTADATVTADYTQIQQQDPELEPTDYDLYIDNELAYNMYTSDPGADSCEWQVAATNIDLVEGQTIQFYIEGSAVAVWMEGAADGCDCPLDTEGNKVHSCVVGLAGFKTNPRPTEFTVLTSGSYDFYFKYYGEYDEAAQSGGYVVWVEGPAGESQKVESDVKLTVGAQEYALTLNTGGGSATQKEYWLGGSKITLNKGDKIKIYVGEDPISAFVEPSSSGVDKSVTDTAIDEFTATFSGEFAVYLKENLNSDGSHKDWSVQFAGSPSVDETDTLPAGAAKVELTFKDGKVTIYLADTEGKGVGANALSGYSVYTYGDEAFGAWDAAKTAGKLSNPSSVSGYNVPNGWIFVWSGAQTSDIIGVFEAGKTYVVYLKDSNVGDCDVKLYTGTDVGGEDSGEPDEPDEPDNPDDLEVEAKLKHGNTEVGLTPSTPEASDKDIVWQMATQSLQLTKGTTIQFYVDGDVVDVWVKEDITAAVSGKNSRVDTITINADGAYDFYLKYYGEFDGYNGGYVLWVEGPEAEDEGDEDQPVSEYEFYLYGTIDGEEKWSKETGEKLTLLSSDDANVLYQYSVTITLHKDDEVKIFRYNAPEGVDGWSYNNFEGTWDYGKVSGDNFVIQTDGVYTFYLKLYDQYGSDPKDGKVGGHGVWVAYEQLQVADELQSGDGVYVGGALNKAFTKKAGANEVVAADITISAQTTFSFKYAGAELTGFTLSGYGTKSGNSVSLGAGTYTFSYNYVSKMLSISGTVIGEPTVTKIGNSGVWLVGEGISGGGWDNGVELTKDGSNWSVSLTLTTGWLKIRNGGSTDGNGVNWLKDGETDIAGYSGSNFVVKAAGRYKITFNGTNIEVEKL